MNCESNVQSDVIFYRILVPHDLSAHSDAAVRLAGTMAHPLRSEVVLVNVIDPNEPRENEGIHSTTSQMADRAHDRWRRLQIVAKRLLPEEVKADVRILSGNPQEIILAEAAKLGADLMIITTHPLTGAGYPFGGDETEQIQRQASCPVLTIPVSEEEEASLARKERSNLQTHSLKQYCELSRYLAKKDAHRPVYLGYSHLPANPSGVCD